MAAALRLLLRRGAETPSAASLALLQPLFPRPYSKLSAPRVPSPLASLLRRTMGESCCRCRGNPPTVVAVRRRSARYSLPPLSWVSAASNLPGMQHVQIQASPLQVPSLIRQYSSKGFAGPLPLQPTDPQTCQFLKQAGSLIGASNDLVKQLALARKGMKTCQKASDLLGSGVDDDKAFAMFEKGLDDALNALVVFEKDLDVLAKASKEMQLDIDLELDRMACKEVKNSFEYLRQEVKDLQRSHKTQRTMEKISKRLDFASVVLEAFVLLLLLLMSLGYI